MMTSYRKRLGVLATLAWEAEKQQDLLLAGDC